MTSNHPESGWPGSPGDPAERQQLAAPDLDAPEDDEDAEDLPPGLPLGGRHLVVADRGTVGMGQAPASTLRVGGSPEAATMDQEHFPNLPGYRILRVLGRGGMGVVYLAEDQRLSRQVAIKMVLCDTTSPETKARFDSEGQLLASISHPGVAKVHEVGFADGRPFLVMEFIDGQTLSELADGRPLAAKVAADFAAQLAIALHACHEKQIIHRDVKPSNAIVDRMGRLKLTDFGLAKLTGQDNRSRLTQTGDVMGTPAYMSPEQASGVVKNLGPRADVYSVGAVLYELVTGRPPFTSPEPLQTILMVLSQPPVAPRSLLPRLSPDLENIILKCLEKSPHHRYVSCEALAADLHRYMQGEPVQARPVPWQRQLSFWLKRHPALATAMALSAVLILSVIVGTSFYNAHLQQELERTQRMVDNSRQFSRWLLYDFSAALEGDQGLTRLRKQLAQKSEEHLNRMQTEVADDHALRLAIADAQLRLSQVHVALGDWSAARKNLQQALATIPQEGGAGSPQERQIAILATIRLAKLDLEDGEMVRGAERLTDARAWMNEIQALVSPDQYQEMFAEWSLVQVDLAGRQGDLQKLESLLAALLESRPQSQASDLTVAEEVDWLLTTWVAKGTLLLRLGQTEPILTDLLPRLAAIKERLSQTSPALGVRAQLASLERFLADALFQRQEFSTALSLYRQQRALWMEVVERDPENLEALHNLALAWQHEAECLMFLDQLPEAREALREALATLERHQTLSGRDWQTDPDSLGYWGTLAYWHWLHGDTNEVIRLRQRVVRQLQPLAKQNVLWQQMLGESLLFIGLAKAQIYTEKMADAVQGDLAELKQAFRDAQAALKQASDYFQDLQQRGVLSPQGAGQKDRAEEMQAFLTESHHKLMATFGEIH